MFPLNKFNKQHIVTPTTGKIRILYEMVLSTPLTLRTNSYCWILNMRMQWVYLVGHIERGAFLAFSCLCNFLVDCFQMHYYPLMLIQQ